MRVLGIETTCDETAAAVVQLQPGGAGEILSNEIMSQIAEHAAYGGVVPEIAARAHIEIIDRLVELALDRAGRRAGRSRRDRRRGGAGSHRRGHGGADHGESLGLGEPQAFPGDQPSRSACLDGAAHRRTRVSLSAALGLRRSHPIGRGEGGRGLSPARLDRRRRGGRGLRQGRQNAGPSLSRRASRRDIGGGGQCRAFRSAAPHAWPAETGLFLFRAENRCPAGSRARRRR